MARSHGGWHSMNVEDLLRGAQQPNSDALYVWRDGEVLADWHSSVGDRPIETMSVTKSIVNLAIGHLLYAGRLPSIDLPVSDFFDEWRVGPKRGILIRHRSSRARPGWRCRRPSSNHPATLSSSTVLADANTTSSCSRACIDRGRVLRDGSKGTFYFSVWKRTLPVQGCIDTARK